MLTLLVITLLTGLTLAVFLYVGGAFLQGYIYTEPSQDLYWQAPASGLVLAGFFFVWLYLIVNTQGASTRDIPYDTVFRFAPRVDRIPEPAKEIWAVKKNGAKVRYTSDRQGQTSWRYLDKSYSPGRPWRDDGVEAVEVVLDNENVIFKRVKGTQGSYGEYVSDTGWIMKEYGDGPTGIPTIFRWGRFLAILFLNFVHFLLWWLCLWLLMRFQWAHALGLAFVMWLIFTLMILPMLIGYAVETAERRATPPPPAVVWWDNQKIMCSRECA